MLIRNLPAVSVVILAALLTNCGHKSKSKTPADVVVAGDPDPKDSNVQKDPPDQKDSPAQKDPVKNENLIVGKWALCDSSLDGSILGLKVRAFKEALSFDADGAQVTDGTLFEDATCSQAYSAESAAADQLILNSMPPVDPDTDADTLDPRAFALDLASFPVKLSNTYTVSALDANGIGTLDVKDSESTSYVSYKISGNQLIIASSCDQADVDSGTCQKITGDSAANRAVDFEYSNTFTKQ